MSSALPLGGKIGRSVVQVEASGAKRGQDDVRVFEPRRWLKLTGIFVAGLLILIWPALCLLASFSTPEMLLQPVMLIADVILIPLLFLLGLMTYFSGAGMRLIIASDRIEYYTVGYSIASDWNNVARVGPMPGAVIGTGLFLRQPATKLSGWLNTVFALRPLFVIMALAEGRYYSGQGRAATSVIPLSAFTGDWQHSEIGELIRRYAPQVFDATKTPGSSPAEVNALYQDVARKSQPKPWPVIAALAGYTGLLWACVLLGAHMQTSDLKATLSGHTDSITSVAYAPDGKLLASASADNTIRVWDVAAKKEKWILKGHAQRITAVNFRPDGAVLASNSYDQSVKLWDMTSGQEIATLNGPEDPVASVAFSPDGKLLATAGRPSQQSNPAVLLWDATNFTKEGKPLAQVATSFSAVHFLAFSPDSNLLAVGKDGGTVEIWDVTAQLLKATVARDGQYDSVETLLYSPDGSKLVRLNRGGQIYLYETTAYQPITTSPLSVRARSIAVSPDGKLLAVGCEDHKVRMVLVATLETVATFPGHNADVSAVAFSADGKTLASADGPILSGGAFRIYLWDIDRLTAGKAKAR